MLVFFCKMVFQLAMLAFPLVLVLYQTFYRRLRQFMAFLLMNTKSNLWKTKRHNFFDIKQNKDTIYLNHKELRCSYYQYKKAVNALVILPLAVYNTDVIRTPGYIGILFLLFHFNYNRKHRCHMSFHSVLNFNRTFMTALIQFFVQFYTIHLISRSNLL